MVWCDVVWCGVIWCDVVWCGVVWCGVVVCVVWCAAVTSTNHNNNSHHHNNHHHLHQSKGVQHSLLDLLEASPMPPSIKSLVFSALHASLTTFSGLQAFLHHQANRDTPYKRIVKLVSTAKVVLGVFGWFWGFFGGVEVMLDSVWVLCIDQSLIYNS